ncbi:MAG: hypothetical protein E5V74_03355 [Mesorhizobium sp.]|nr:MAG: hypothetical protein E5V74_03355 [Mesorhizobium sp.]
MPHVQTPVTNYARSRGWLARRVQYIGRHGAPDTWFVKGGRWIIVEFKNLDEPPKIHQTREHKRLRAHGAEVHVIDNVEDGCALFD